MYGIPNMKLEKTVIERRVKLMEEEGVIFRTGINVGKDVSAEEIMKSFDAVILCCRVQIQEIFKLPEEILTVYITHLIF